MTDWPRSVAFPGFETAHHRRRKSISEPVRTTDPPDPATALLALGLMASRSTDVAVVTIPVLEGATWRAITLDFGAKAGASQLRAQVRDDLGGPSIDLPPPPSSVVAVLDDGLVDPSHVALRFLEGRLRLHGPIEPLGGLGHLARRLSWLIDEVAVDQPVADIASIAPDEQASTVLDRIGPSLGPLRHVLSRIERMARSTPHAAAITTPWTTLSYDELMNVVADRQAMLGRAGIRDGDIVGLHISRSSDLVATMLAIWETRASFIPITADHPRAWIAQMLGDAGASRVVTDLGGWRAPSRSIKRVDVDRDIHERRVVPRRHPTRSLDSTAYVPFMSGAAGRPRGVDVTHRNLDHYLQSVSVALPAVERGVMLATTPIGSDASMLELIWPLTQGWEIIIDPGRDVPMGPVSRRRRVTHLHTTPTRASLMTHSRDGREILETIDCLLLSGEAVRAEFLAELRKTTRADVIVSYGPTECTVGVTWGVTDPAMSDGIVPIGRPLPGHAVDIVDRRDRMVGPYSIGELVVMGDAVTAGYLGSSKGPSPFVSHRGERTFRTGDLAWSDDDGLIHLAGRRDRRANVRGHRVEISEIDGRLVSHRSVVDAATITVGSEETRRLESFVVEAEPTTDHELWDWLRESLPEPMIPSTIHRIETLPTSATDHHDLDALQRLALEHARLRPPRRELTVTEALVARIFEDTLDVAQVPPDRSIFDLGGSSESASRLASELEAMIDRRVGVASLLDTGSVETIAAAIDEGRLGGEPATLVPIVTDGPGLPVYCVAGPDGHALNLRPLGEALGRPFYGLQFAGTNGTTAPDPTIRAMADRFVEAVHEHRGNRPIALGGYAEGGYVALEMAKRLEAMGTRVKLLFLIDSLSPQLEDRSLGQKVMDGIRDLRAPDDLSAVSVLRNRFVADRLARQDNLFSATRRGRVPNAVDLTNDFERAAARWAPPTHPGPVLVIRSAVVAPAYRGWDRVATGPIETVSVEGGHVRMMLPPLVDDLAEKLRDGIERVEASHRR